LCSPIAFGENSMNNNMKKFQAENMIFQAKQTTTDALIILKLFVVLSLIGGFIIWWLK